MSRISTNCKTNLSLRFKMNYLAAATNEDFLRMAKKACTGDSVELKELSNILIDIRGMYSAIKQENGDDSEPICVRFKDFEQWLRTPIATVPELIVSFSAMLSVADMLQTYDIEDSNIIECFNSIIETTRLGIKNYIDCDTTHVLPVFHLMTYIETPQREAGDLRWIPNALDEESACENLIVWLLSKYPDILDSFQRMFSITHGPISGADMDIVFTTLNNVLTWDNLVVASKPIEFEL